MQSMEALVSERLALMKPKPNCTKCIIEFDLDTMQNVGEWILCEDCDGTNG